jgi:hypothetical protein
MVTMGGYRTRLEPFPGEWTMRVTFPGAPPAEGGRVVFKWTTGERFLIERWETPVPEAADGLAIIGYDEGSGTLLQHDLDSRGVMPVYTMSVEDGGWQGSGSCGAPPRTSRRRTSRSAHRRRVLRG